MDRSADRSPQYDRIVQECVSFERCGGCEFGPPVHGAGMDHCAGGAGPSHFDMTTALTNWVEHGKAPEMILAVHLPDGPPGAHGPRQHSSAMRLPADRELQRDGQHGRGHQLCMHEGMKMPMASVIEACLFVKEWRPNSRS